MSAQARLLLTPSRPRARDDVLPPDQRPEPSSRLTLLALQRSAGNHAVTRLMPGTARGRLLQRKKGDEDDPHMVPEGHYLYVPAGEHVKVPNVSGCAAVSLTVYGKGRDDDEKEIAHIAFHSDGLAEKGETAVALDKMAEQIVESGATRVKAVAILNGHQFDGLADHTAVLKLLGAKLTKLANKGKDKEKAKGVEFDFTFAFEKLIRDTKERETIDLTGGTEETLERYERRFHFGEDELATKRNALTEYNELRDEARELQVFKKNLRRGRGQVKNKNYVGEITMKEFSKLEPDEAEAAVVELKDKVAASRACCVIL